MTWKVKRIESIEGGSSGGGGGGGRGRRRGRPLQTPPETPAALVGRCLPAVMLIVEMAGRRSVEGCWAAYSTEQHTVSTGANRSRRPLSGEGLRPHSRTGDETVPTRG